MKRIICLILCLILTLGIFGCAKDLDASESNNSEDYAQGKTIACCMGAIYHPVHKVVQYGFCTKAEELGMTPVISGLDEGSISELRDKWNSDIASNNAVGAMIWTGDDSCYQMMKSLKEQGIYTVVPHFVHDYNYTKEFIDKNIAYTEKEFGREMAELIVDKLTEAGITKGSIGVSQSGASVASGNLANDTFRQVMSETAPNFIILDTMLEGPDHAGVTSKITTYIENNPDMVAAIGLTGGSAQSWSEAKANTGREDIIVVGMVYTEANINTVMNGSISGIVCLPLYDESAACANALYELVNGEIFNSSADTWLEYIEAPIATLDGEGKNNIQTYYDIFNAAQDYFEE